MFFGMLLSLRSFLSPSFRFRSSCGRFLHSPFLVSLLRPFLPLFLLSLSRGGGRRRARLSKENEGNDMMEGGLLQLLVTTSLHVSVWFFFLAGNMGALGGPWETLSEGRPKLLGRLRGVWSVWKEAVRDHVQNRTHRLYRVRLVKLERMSN